MAYRRTTATRSRTRTATSKRSSTRTGASYSRKKRTTRRASSRGRATRSSPQTIKLVLEVAPNNPVARPLAASEPDGPKRGRF